MTLTLWMPFTLTEGSALQISTEENGEVFECPCRLSSQQGHYILEVQKIPDRAAGERLLRHLTVGLTWTALKLGTGVYFSTVLQDVTMASDPTSAAANLRASFGGEPKPDEQVHGIIEGTKPALVPFGNFRKIWLGMVSAQTSWPGAGALETITEGAQLASGERVASDPKLQLALELYSISHLEATQSARLITLCSALEAAAPAPEIAASVELISRWQSEARAAADGTAGDEATELRALAERLGNLRRVSHRKRIQEYVLKTLRAIADPEAETKAREVGELYAVRGSLVHDGILRDTTAASRLDEIMRKTLAAAVAGPEKSVAGAGPA